MKRFFNKYFGNKQNHENQSEKARLADRLAHIGRKMTRGAANIYRSLGGTRATFSWRSWGQKNHHKPK